MDHGEDSHESSSPDPLIGTTLDGKYRIESKLGSGGMGVVYAATQQSLGREVALKILSPRWNKDHRAEARFRVEARAASLLKNRHAVTVHDFGVTHEGLLYLAMELLKGESLGERLKRGPLPWQEAALVAAQVAEALAEAHAQNPRIIHRDIKPDNVVIRETPSGLLDATVLDFGLALLADDPRITQQDLVVGTVAYMAPEQATGESTIDDRIDVYALGITLFQMVTGNTPFEAPNHVGVLHKHVYETPPSLLKTTPDAPEKLNSLVQQMLAKKPRRRPPAYEVMARLLTMLGQMPGGEHTPATEIDVGALVRDTPIWRRPLTIVVTSAAVALTTLGFAYWRLAHQVSARADRVVATPAPVPAIVNAPIPAAPPAPAISPTQDHTKSARPPKHTARTSGPREGSDDEFLAPFQPGHP